MKQYNNGIIAKKISKSSLMLKKILFSTIVVLLIGGCAQRDAFSQFDLTSDQERSIDNAFYARLTKIIKDDNITSHTQVSAVTAGLYLNELYPNRYDDAEQFYIVFFAKNKALLQYFQFQLNGNNPIKVVKLPAENEYSHLMKMNNKWSTHYLLTFQKIKSKTLKLKVKILDGSKATLIFHKTPR